MRTILSATFALFGLLSLLSGCGSPAVPVQQAETPEEVSDVDEPLAPPLPQEFLAKIAAPLVRPVIKTERGYKVELDLSKQILSIESPKKIIWGSEVIDVPQTVKVITEGASLEENSQVLARLKKGRILYASKERGDWVLTQIVEGDKAVKGWVQKKHLKPVAEAYPPEKSLARQGSNFASAAMLIQKGKQFDDGLYAATELAMQNGHGAVAGKKDWLPRLAAAVDVREGGMPLAQLLAAVRLGGNKAAPPAAVAAKAEGQIKDFLADNTRSKPLGFYPWSPELKSIFRQDRMLQTSLDPQGSTPGITAIAKALAADAEARKSYEQVLRVNERLTNRLTGPGYRDLLTQIDAGKPLKFDPAGVSFFPSSRSHENDLIMRLDGNSPVPEGFDLMTKVIALLKSGNLSFQPQPDSGWYDHQLWSLEPLVRFDAAPEAKQLQPNDAYRKHLEELFKGTYALMRETHIRQLDVKKTEEAREPEEEKVREKVYISPDPHVELLPTMYLRRAQSYRFVREVLEETFGKENIKELHRLTATGPVEMNLADELDQMERLFSGAYVVACREIGMNEELPKDLGEGQSADEQGATFLRWVASLSSDPDLAPDSRMMVPVFFDQERQKTKVWVMLGWEQANCAFGYVQEPGVKITDPDGKPVAGDNAPEVYFSGTHRALATPVFAEVYVTKLLNRTEFRRHCDTYQTKAAILANLE